MNNTLNDTLISSLSKDFQGTEFGEGPKSDQYKLKLGKLDMIMTPISNSLTEDFEQMTLDTSPKESIVNHKQCQYIDTINEQEDNKSKLQKYQSFKMPKEQIRRSPKHKTCQPLQTLSSWDIDEFNQKSQIHQQLSDNPSMNAQTLKFIKELWNSDKSETEQYNEMIQYKISYLNQSIYSPLIDCHNQIYIEMDLYITNLIDQLWGNQIVSRKLQKILESGSNDQKELIVQKLENASPQVEKDIFGNYVVQKVFECNDNKLQLRMFNKLKPHFYDLSKNTYGCRVIQKLIEYTYNQNDLQNIILQQLQINMRSLIFDLNGNYVIFKMLEIYDKQKMEFIIPIVEESFNYLGQQIYGCKIIHKIIQQYSQQQIIKIIRLSVSNYNILSQTEYGNYVLQHILQFWIPSQEKTYLVQLVVQQFFQLSINKYASNTVERALEVLGKQELICIMKWLLSKSSNQYTSNFVVLANHQCANYVIKKFLVLSDHNVLKYISDHLYQNQSEQSAINQTVHGQRLKSFLEKQIQNWP
ncbi:unnamed protein product [Paramecium sonneborni]|uniref:PUM-HD domain-containing protein n=1 Tax=Paramecium sonneborni TaxID=65129 RepID=A0A8S1MW81_9CILI|nr:unnamed protein product [Paramecium sonneborni]